MLKRLVTVSLAAICFPCIPSSNAATVKATTSKDKLLINLSGEITPGDTDKITKLIKSINGKGQIVSGIFLNSRGGNLQEEE